MEINNALREIKEGLKGIHVVDEDYKKRKNEIAFRPSDETVREGLPDFSAATRSMAQLKPTSPTN